MSRVHYFQRYHQKENVVTNNTLLLLSRLYHYSPGVFEDVLRALLGTAELSVGPSFRQQERRGRRSVPDADITQERFRVIVETKLGRHFSEDQLSTHLQQFQEQGLRVLLLLGPHEPDEALVKRIREHALDVGNGGVTVASATFEQVVQEVESALPEHAFEMRDMIEDYEAFCSVSGLLPTDHVKLRVVTCGHSLEENLRYGLYYHSADRGYSDLGYLGFYANKAVRGLGRVKTIVQADLVDGAVVVLEERRKTQKLDKKDKTNIASAMQDAKTKRGWEIEEGHLFFVLEEAFETEFTKTSKYGLLGERHFDLREELGVSGDLPSPREIAESLKSHTWE